MRSNRNKKILITGSTGLVGSEAAKFFGVELGFEVYGVDNDMRSYFFGKDASTQWERKELERLLKDKYKHYSVDIRDQAQIENIFIDNPFDLIIHAAAQPSHDWAIREPITDFTINALGTLYLLEMYRKYSPSAVFIFTSTNKVYGDRPNTLPLKEQDTRYELPVEHKNYNGIDETMSIDQSTHSLFGASKVSADILVQEYGRYFGLNTGVFRGGCLTGPSHSGAKLHGFLAYLVKSLVKNEEYTIIGYKGKQVRDNIHSHDLISAFYEFFKNPKKGEVYNIGGSRYSNISILEAITIIESILGRKAKVKYEESNRIGDHLWYISDVSKFKSHFPKWNYNYNVNQIIEDIIEKGHIL